MPLPLITTADAAAAGAIERKPPSRPFQGHTSSVLSCVSQPSFALPSWPCLQMLCNVWLHCSSIPKELYVHGGHMLSYPVIEHQFGICKDAHTHIEKINEAN